MRHRQTYQEAKIETKDDTNKDRDGSKFDVANMAGERLGDDIVSVSTESTEYGWAYDAPQHF